MEIHICTLVNSDSSIRLTRKRRRRQKRQDCSPASMLPSSDYKDRESVPVANLAIEIYIGRIRLSVSTASRTYELSEETTWHPSVRTNFIRLGSVSTNRKNGFIRETCCRYGLTVRKYWAQSNIFRTYGRVSRGLFPRIRRYGLGRHQVKVWVADDRQQCQVHRVVLSTNYIKW